MRILVTGPTGFVGARVMHALGAEAIPAPSLRNLDEGDVRRLIDDCRPDLIVHTAAMSDIPTCEADPEGSYRANVLIPLMLARTGVKAVMFSSDQVYSGCAADGPYAEDTVAPANLYARHKLEMENRVLDIAPDTVFLRATWMYDMPIYGIKNRGNFLMMMLRRSEAAFSATEHRAVTYVREVAAHILEAARLPGGVYNYGSENDLTMLDVANWFKDRLKLPIALRDSGKAHHLWMDCGKIKEQGIHFMNTLDGLERCIADYALDMDLKE